MPVSPYFSQHKSPAQEYDLVNDLVVECIQQRGILTKYSPMVMNSEDQIFGEDGSASFDEAVEIEMLPTEVESFGGEGLFASSLGLDIRDTFDLVVSQTRFTESVVERYPEISRPMEGDLIIISLSTDDDPFILEITYVDEHKEFFTLGNNYTFSLNCKKWEFSHEEMDTGVEGVDDLEDYEAELEEASAGYDNEKIQDEADNILNFSENDPFGEDY